MAKETNFEHPPRGHVAILIYDPTNDRFQVVQGDDVDTAIPAAGKALLASTLAHGYHDSAWRKQPLSWGYTDRWAEEVGETKSGDGTYLAATVAVPAGYVYVAQFAFLRNAGGARGSMYIAFIIGADAYYALYQTQPARYTAYLWNGVAPLKDGDTIRFVQSTCLDGDVITAGVWGYKMAINL